MRVAEGDRYVLVNLPGDSLLVEMLRSSLESGLAATMTHTSRHSFKPLFHYLYRKAIDEFDQVRGSANLTAQDTSGMLRRSNCRDTADLRESPRTVAKLGC